MVVEEEVEESPLEELHPTIMRQTGDAAEEGFSSCATDSLALFVEVCLHGACWKAT